LPHLKPTIETLSGFGSFTRVIAYGMKYERKPIKAFVCSSPSEHAGLRVGFAVTRKVRKAVHRNLIKRTMREAFRARAGVFVEHIGPGSLLEIIFLFNGDIKLQSKKARSVSINQALADLSLINIAGAR